MIPVNNISDRITLNDGAKMPLFGLGCWAMEGEDATYDSVLLALKEGYRLIDTAAMYKNEEAVGRALKDCGLKREEYYLVTKLSSSCHGYNEAKEACQQSLDKLGLEYVDMYLIHTPRPGRIEETWRALNDLKKEGKTKSIGVSNCSGEHINGLLSLGMDKPAVNQIELHPLLQQVSQCRFFSFFYTLPELKGKPFDQESKNNL